MSALGRKIVRAGYALGHKFIGKGALGLKALDTTAHKASHTLRDINAAYDSAAGRKVRDVVNLLPGGGEATALANTVRGFSGRAERAIDNTRSGIQKLNTMPSDSSSFA
jgi:hypothetical protein